MPQFVHSPTRLALPSSTNVKASEPVHRHTTVAAIGHPHTHLTTIDATAPVAVATTAVPRASPSRTRQLMQPRGALTCCAHSCFRRERSSAPSTATTPSPPSPQPPLPSSPLSSSSPTPSDTAQRPENHINPDNQPPTPPSTSSHPRYPQHPSPQPSSSNAIPPPQPFRHPPSVPTTPMRSPLSPTPTSTPPAPTPISTSTATPPLSLLARARRRRKIRAKLDHIARVVSTPHLHHNAALALFSETACAILTESGELIVATNAAATAAAPRLQALAPKLRAVRSSATAMADALRQPAVDVVHLRGSRSAMLHAYAIDGHTLVAVTEVSPGARNLDAVVERVDKCLGLGGHGRTHIDDLARMLREF